MLLVSGSPSGAKYSPNCRSICRPRSPLILSFTVPAEFTPKSYKNPSRSSLAIFFCLFDNVAADYVFPEPAFSYQNRLYLAHGRYRLRLAQALFAARSLRRQGVFPSTVVKFGPGPAGNFKARVVVAAATQVIENDRGGRSFD